jgi:hypothetical protein
MKAKQIYYIIIALLFITSCAKDYDLEKTIFHSDPDFPDLPMYTEWGYNTFGAFYDRQVFTSSDNIIPLKVIVKNDTTFFRFSGSLNYHDPMTMTFTMNDFLPVQYSNLIELDKKSLDLTDPRYGVTISIDDVDQELTILSGILEFKKAQNLIIDEVQEEVILSGVFEFQVIIDAEPFTISRGRFDMGISNDSFFKL